MIKEHFAVEDNLKNHYLVLINMILEFKINRMAEIGVYGGHCMRSILRSSANTIVREYWAIDQWVAIPWQWKGKEQKDWDAKYREALKYYPWFPQLRILKSSSVEAAPIFWDGYFDLIYIDADHTYESVVQDIKAWMPKVRKGGILAGHDYTPKMRKNHQVKAAVDSFFDVKIINLEKCCVWWVFI